MAGENTTTTLNGLYKEIYAGKIEHLVPLQNKILKDVQFIGSAQHEGNKFNQPVNLTQEHGVTYAAPDSGAFTLEAAIASNTKNAEVQGSQILLRGSLSYNAAAKAVNSKGAFVTATHYLITNMLNSISKRTELSSWYGGTGIGQAASSVNTDATHTVVTMSTAQFATGIWVGMENAKINFFTTVPVQVGTVFTIDSVDILNKAITVSAAAGDITALDAALPAVLDIFFNDAKTKEMAGIDQIILNAATLFNISAATYSLWKGQTVDVSAGALTIGKVLNGLSTAQAFGLDEMVCLYVNPITWNNINAELSGSRRFDSSYKKTGTNGFEEIMYYSQNGGIKIKSHSYIKESEAFCLPLSKWKRLGAQDISFNTPGRGKEEIFRHLESAAGYEFRVYTNQAMFTDHPARSIKFFNITNT